jgi:YD repeat-containing protein
VYVNLAYEYRKPGSAADDIPLRSAVTDVVTGRRTAYSYDPDYDQLTGAATTVAGAPVTTYTYGYNVNGQRITAAVNGVATGYTYNAASQLTAVTGPGAGAAAGTYTYDANGNQTSGGGRTMSYNDRDQTTTVNTEGAGYEDIDQAHRATLGTRSFLNTPLGVTRYTDPAAATTDVIREPTGQLTALRRTSGTHYPITDALGSVVALTDPAGTKTDTFTYDPYGAGDPAHRQHREPLPVRRRTPRPHRPVQARGPLLRPRPRPVHPT